MDPIVLGPGDGEKVEIAGNELLFKAESKDTGGSLAISEYTAGPGFDGPPLHLHREMTDMFFVLEGTLTFTLAAGKTFEAAAGTFVLVPPGNPHTFSNPGSEPARFLSLFSPGGFEGYLKELATAMTGGDFDPAVAGQIASRYDYEAV